MGTKKELPEKRRNQILDAAMDVFSRLGFHKARMDDIVQVSGLSKGTIYWYFKSKDAVIAAILDRIFSREHRALKDVLSGEGPVSDRLLNLVRQSARHTQSLKFSVPLMFEFYALAARHEQVHSAMQRYYATYRSDLAQLIQEGVDSGEFTAVAADKVALSIIAAFEGLILLWVVDSERVALEEDALNSLRIIIDSLHRGGTYENGKSHKSVSSEQEENHNVKVSFR